MSFDGHCAYAQRFAYKSSVIPEVCKEATILLALKGVRDGG